MLESLRMLVEIWIETESWTIGKSIMGLIVFLWLLGSITFILKYLGKKIFSFGKG